MSKRLIITLSDELHSAVETSAKKLGVSITEYVRFLILKAQERERELDIQL